MSVIGNQATTAKHPTVKFAQMGNSVAGRIIEFEEYQEKEFGSNELRFFPSGDPIMGVKVILETNPGDASSRVQLFAQGKRMLQAIAKAVKGAEAADLEIGADLAVQFTGYDGRAKVYEAKYMRPE